MHGAQEATLKQLTNEFEKKNPNVKVKLENQGSYIDLQGKLTSTMQSPKNLPTITQAYPDWLYNATQNKMLVNLTPYINNKNVGWGSAQKSGIRAELLDGAKIKNTQYGSHLTSRSTFWFITRPCLRNMALKRCQQPWLS